MGRLSNLIRRVPIGGRPQSQSQRKKMWSYKWRSEWYRSEPKNAATSKSWSAEWTYFPLPDPPERMQLHQPYLERLFQIFGEGIGNPFQYSCLENLTDRGAWQAVIHGATKSRTGLSDFTCCCCCFQIFPNDKGFCLRFLLITCFCLFLHYVTVSLGIYHNV